MRNFAFVCAGLALVGGVVSATLWRELRAEREQTAQLRTQVLSLQAGVPQSPSLAPPPTLQQPELVAAQARPPQPVTAANAQPGVPQAPAPNAVPDFILSQQEMMKDPEYRRARVAQTRASLITQTYAGLAEELGLTPEEADSLFDLLAENQVEMSSASLLGATVNGVAPDPAQAEEARRLRTEQQRRHEQELQSMLGASRYAGFQDFQQTLGARQQVTQLERTLQGGAMALTAEQRRPLTAAFVAEERRQREEMRRFNSAPATAANRQLMMEERFKSQEESNRRLVDAAKSHLTAPQLDALRDSLQQQLVMNRASTRISLQRMEAQEARGGQAQTGTVTLMQPLVLTQP